MKPPWNQHVLENKKVAILFEISSSMRFQNFTCKAESIFFQKHTHRAKATFLEERMLKLPMSNRMLLNTKQILLICLESEKKIKKQQQKKTKTETEFFLSCV